MVAATDGERRPSKYSQIMRMVALQVIRKPHRLMCNHGPTKLLAGRKVPITLRVSSLQLKGETYMAIWASPFPEHFACHPAFMPETGRKARQTD